MGEDSPFNQVWEWYWNMWWIGKWWKLDVRNWPNLTDQWRESSNGPPWILVAGTTKHCYLETPVHRSNPVTRSHSWSRDAYQRCKQIKQGKFPIYIGMTPQSLMVTIPSIPMICWLVHWARSSTDQHVYIYIKHIYIYSFIKYKSYDIIYIYTICFYNIIIYHPGYIMSRFPSSLVIQFPGWFPRNSNFRPASLVPFASKALHRWNHWCETTLGRSPILKNMENSIVYNSM